MKNNLLCVILFVCSAVATQLITQHVWAQTVGASDDMTVEQLTSIKQIKIPNLDKDTYFKSGGFILDRYEERPPYVFNYSDGIQRKIYLYKVYTAADTKELGLLAVYLNGKTNETKSFVIPGAHADRKAWDRYIDDLKYVGEKEAGLMSTLSFVLAREMTLLLAARGGAPEETYKKKKEEYNFCFPENASVTLADGRILTLQDVKIGDKVMAYDVYRRQLVPARVNKVQIHEGRSFVLTGVWLMPVQEVTAGVRTALPMPVLMEATALHPVLTTTGPKQFGELIQGDILYRYEGTRQAVAAWKIVSIQPSLRTVEKVYNLQTERGSYLINDIVVLDK